MGGDLPRDGGHPTVFVSCDGLNSSAFRQVIVFAVRAARPILPPWNDARDPMISVWTVRAQRTLTVAPPDQMISDRLQNERYVWVQPSQVLLQCRHQ